MIHFCFYYVPQCFRINNLKKDPDFSLNFTLNFVPSPTIVSQSFQSWKDGSGSDKIFLVFKEILISIFCRIERDDKRNVSQPERKEWLGDHWPPRHGTTQQCSQLDFCREHRPIMNLANELRQNHLNGLEVLGVSTEIYNPAIPPTLLPYQPNLHTCEDPF